MVRHRLVTLVVGVSQLNSTTWTGNERPYIFELRVMILQFSFNSNQKYEVLHSCQLQLDEVRRGVIDQGFSVSREVEGLLQTLACLVQCPLGF